MSFDKINHNILLIKLKNNEIPYSKLSWHKIYVVSRLQIINIYNYYSTPIVVI